MACLLDSLVGFEFFEVSVVVRQVVRITSDAVIGLLRELEQRHAEAKTIYTDPL